jgi:hypothetical protein
MNEILCHPWLTSTSSNHSTFVNPLETLPLDGPMINHVFDLDGRTWETLKVLWQDFQQDEIIHALTCHG